MPSICHFYAESTLLYTPKPIQWEDMDKGPGRTLRATLYTPKRLNRSLSLSLGARRNPVACLYTWERHPLYCTLYRTGHREAAATFMYTRKRPFHSPSISLSYKLDRLMQF